MHPVLFRLKLPHFLHGILSDYFTIYTYGFLIAVGIVLAYIYTTWQARKQLGLKSDVITNMTIVIMIAAFIGGKIFFYFEDPSFYFGHPANMLKYMNSGFVFYGSLIFAVPSIIWFFKKNKIPVFKMLDIIAITACIVHAFGRTGCFMAGCCFGKPTESFFGVIFSNPVCAASPLNIPLHPTQLYDVFLLLTIIVILLIIKKHKRFDLYNALCFWKEYDRDIPWRCGKGIHH